MERMTSPNIDNRKTAILEKTLALIKPDGMQFREAIMKRIRRAGFAILQSRIVKLSPEQASEFYKSKSDSPKYPLMVITLTEGPIMAMCLSKLAAIKEWKALMGPEAHNVASFYWPGSLRAEFADPNDEFKNAVHGSDNADLARYELKFFFPNMIVEPILSPQEYRNYLQAHINPIVMEGLYKITKLKPPEPIEWLAEWLYLHNPNKPEIYNTDESVLRKICQLQEQENKLQNMGEQQSQDFDDECICNPQDIPAKECEPDNCGLMMFDEPSDFTILEPSEDTICPICGKPFEYNGKIESSLENASTMICCCNTTQNNQINANYNNTEEIIKVDTEK